MIPKSVFITGASSGLGRALALEYGKRGAHVTVAARRETELASLQTEIEAAGGKASVLVLDVADAEAAHGAARKADALMGSLDLVIANAGLGGATHASRIELSDLSRMMDVNVRGAMATLLGAVPIMMEQKRGQLAGVSSLAGRRVLPAGAPYSASKAALAVFMEGLRLDLATAGIEVSDVQPGFVDTPLTQKNDFEMPFIWPAERAARYIADRLESNPRIVAFPFPLTFLTRVSQLMPFGLYRMLVSRLR